MNERFEQLKRRAVAEADTSHIDFDNMSPTDIRMLGDIAVEKKFAELIIRECINLIESKRSSGENTDSWTITRDMSFHYMKQDLKEHFGVEE